MSKRLKVEILLAVVLVLGCWVAFQVFRANAKVVTIRVQNEDVREVIHKVERQTWETIPVHKEVTGTISMDVADAPLREVLMLIADQVGARAQALQPLYSSKDSLYGFIQATRGDAEPAKAGWTKLADIIHPPLAAAPSQRPSPEQPITLHLTNHDLRIAGLAFSRLAHVQVVPEDGTSNKVSLNLENASTKTAASTLAESVHRKTKVCIALLPGGSPGGLGRPGGPGGLGGPGAPPGPGRPPGGPGTPPLGGPGSSPGGPGGPSRPGDPSGLGRPGLLPPNPEAGGSSGGGPPPPGGRKPPSKEMQQQMDKDYQDLLAVLPKAEAARLQSERAMQNVMEHGLPEQRQEVGAQLGPMVQDRRQMLLSTSPAERVEQDRKKLEGK